MFNSHLEQQNFSTKISPANFDWNRNCMLHCFMFPTPSDFMSQFFTKISIILHLLNES